MTGRHGGEFRLDGLPDGHRIYPDAVASHARDEHLRTMGFYERTEAVRDLQPALVVDFCGRSASEDDLLLHFTPQQSTGIVGNSLDRVNGNPRGSVTYA